HRINIKNNIFALEFENQKSFKTMKEPIPKHVLSMSKLFLLAITIQSLTMGFLLAGNFSKGKTGTVAKQYEVAVTGAVKDTNGEPIPGVTIYIPGTTVGTVTDINGNYTLSVPENSTLVF